MKRLVLGFSLLLLLSIDIVPTGTARAYAGVSGDAIVQTALQYVGYPYTTVGNSPSTGFSCIGFVSYVYQSNGIPLPDDLWDAMAYAPAVSFSDLQPGDVLFFQNTVWSGLSHTAIYLGGGRFVHAEWYNRGVVTSSFTNDPVDGNYWIEHYLGASRPWTTAPIEGTAPQPAASTTPAPSAPTSTAPAPQTPASPPQPQLEVGPRAIVHVAALNVRVRPSLLAPIRRLAPQGTQVVVLKQYQSWDWVQFPSGRFGWVAGAAIGVRGAAAPRNTLAAPLPLNVVSADGLRVHVRPNLAAPAVASAYRGQKLLVLKRWLGWVRVLLPGGTRGWVDGAYVAAGTTPQAPSGSAVSIHSRSRIRRAGSTLSATVRIHVRPNLLAPILRLAPAGAHVRVFESYLSWLYVRFPSGRGGWVDGAYVRHV